MKKIVLLGLQSTSNLGDRLVYACTRKITEGILEKHGVGDAEIVSYDMLGKDYYSYLSEKKKKDAEILIRYPLEAEERIRLEEEKERFVRKYEEEHAEKAAVPRTADDVSWDDGADDTQKTIRVCKRSLPTCILLSVLTLGVYFIYWEYLLVKNTRQVKRDLSPCTREMLCLIFVPFYSLYWFYTRGKLLKDAFPRHGYTAAGSETAYLILCIFGLGIVSAALMQNDFNALPSAAAPEKSALTEEEKQALIDREVEERTALYDENAKTEKKEKLIASARRGAKKIIDDETAAVIFFGGGIIKPGHSLQLGYCMEPYIRRANELGVPVMISAAGVDGYDADDDESRVFAEILNLPCVKTVTVRDDIELLRRVYVTSPEIRVRKVPCPTLLCGELFPMGTIREAGTIGLGVINAKKMTEIHPDFTEEKQIALWKGIIEEIEKRGCRWTFFANGLPADHKFAKQILKAMEKPVSGDTLLPNPQSLHQLLDSFNLFDGIVASRFHAAVPAYSYGVPFVELVWNIKQTHFARDMRLEDSFFDPETASPAQIVGKLFENMKDPRPECPVDPQDTVDELERFLTDYCLK